VPQRLSNEGEIVKKSDSHPRRKLTKWAGAMAASAAIPSATAAQDTKLGAVEIHRELMTAAARWMAALKLESVLSARIAIRLNSFSLPKKFSIR
jgi:hypothetical protein